MRKFEKLAINRELQAARQSDEDCASDGADRRSLVSAMISQGYETRVNVRVVPGRSLGAGLARKRCEPRQGAPRRDAEPLDLPEDLVGKLKDADKAVVAWLAKDPANMKLFLANPAQALANADVDLSRAELKAIDRAHGAVREATVVGPGVRVTDLRAEAFPKGRVGKIKPKGKDQSGGSKRAGCVKED